VSHAGAPRSTGLREGLHEGMATNGTEFHPVFVVANTGNTANRTDVVASQF